jgi:FkbM family methyltransferase
MPISSAMAEKLNSIASKLTGFEVHRSSPSFNSIRAKAIQLLAIDTVVDGGANSGQWAQGILSNNSSFVKLHSFEPVPTPFSELMVISDGVENWFAHNKALGASEGKLSMNISSNAAMSSSALSFGEHSKVYPNVSFVGEVLVDMVRLDSYSQILGESIFLKLDLQGFEPEAVAGASGILDRVLMLEVETCYSPMYEGQKTHYEFVPELLSMGYEFIAATSPSQDHSGKWVYTDVLLVKGTHVNMLH